MKSKVWLYLRMILQFYLSIVPICLSAQSFSERFNSDKVHTQLALQVHSGTFTLKYQIDKKSLTDFTEDDKLFALKNNANLKFYFFNPSKYVIELKDQDKPDPFFTSAETFLRKIEPFFKDLGLGTSVSQTTPSLPIPAAAEAQVTPIDIRDIVRTTELVNWILWQNSTEAQNCSVNWGKSLNPNIRSMEEYFYYQFPLTVKGVSTPVTKTFKEHIIQILTTLQNSGDFKNFMVDYESAKNHLAALKTKQADILVVAKKTLQSDLTLVMPTFGTATGAPPGSADFCNAFKVITETTLKNYITFATETAEKRQDAISSLQSFFDYLKNFIDTNSDFDEHNVLTNVTFEKPMALKKGKITTFEINLKQVDIGSASDVELLKIGTKKLEKKFDLVRSSSALFEAGAGIMYSDFEFLEYETTTANNTTVVAEVKRVRPTFVPMVWGNLILDTWKFPIYPMLQIGAGATSGQPVFAFGGGFRFDVIDNFPFAVSGGVAPYWTKALQNLKVGDEVSGTAEIVADTKYKLHSPKFYFGIQFQINN